MTVEQICEELKCGLFADRDTLEEAQMYMAKVCTTLPAEHRIGVYTAIGVLLNTVAKELEVAIVPTTSGEK